MPEARGATPDSTLPVRLRLTPGSIVRGVLLVGAFIILTQIASAAATPIMWFVEGVVGAALLFPLVALLARRMPHWAAVALVSVGIVLVVAVIGLRLFTELRDEANQFSAEAPQLAQQIESSSTVGDAAKKFGLGDKIQRVASDVSGAFNFSDASVSTISTAASFGSAVFVVWLFGVMMLFSAPRFLDGAARQVRSSSRRERLSDVVSVGYRNSWRYFALMFARSLVLGVATWILAWAFGLRAPTLLAVWVAVWSFVPAVGLLFGGALVAVVAMFTSFALSGWLLLGFVAVLLVDVQFLQPRIDRSTVHVGPALTMTAALVGFGVYGFGGTIVACTLLFFGLAVLDVVRPDPDGGRALVEERAGALSETPAGAAPTG